MVVPDHDLVGRVMGIGSAADKGDDVAAEEHRDVTDPSAVKLAAELLAEGVAIIDAETVVSGGGEASMVLVEGDVEHRRGLRRGESRRRCGGGAVALWRFRLLRHEGFEVECLGLVGKEIRVWI